MSFIVSERLAGVVTPESLAGEILRSQISTGSKDLMFDPEEVHVDFRDKTARVKYTLSSASFHDLLSADSLKVILCSKHYEVLDMRLYNIRDDKLRCEMLLSLVNS